MEFRLRPWVSWSFLQNNNHLAVKKMKIKKNTKNTDKNRWDFERMFACGC